MAALVPYPDVLWYVPRRLYKQADHRTILAYDLHLPQELLCCSIQAVQDATSVKALVENLGEEFRRTRRPENYQYYTETSAAESSD